MGWCITRLAITVTVVLLWAPADAREWKIKNDRFEAELVDIDGNMARMRRTNGEIRGYSLGAFSGVDREFLDQWLVREQGDPPGEKITVDAAAFRETMRYVGNDPPPESVTVVVLKFHGNDAAAATSVRDLKLDQAVSDAGVKLELSPQTMASGDRPVTLSRYGSLEQPAWGFRTKLIFKASEKPLKSLRSLSGSLAMVTGRRKTFEIDRPGERKNQVFDLELLRQAGLQATVDPQPRGAGVFYAGQERLVQYFLRMNGPTARVFSVEMLDGQGKLIEDFAGRSSAGSSSLDHVSGKRSESKTYQFEFWPPGPAAVRMRVTVLEDPREVRVPFELTDLGVP